MTLLEEIQQRLSNLPLDKQSEVLDFVAFLQERAGVAQSASMKSARKKRIKSALTNLASMGTFAEIANPVEWQRQIRRDRPLPGRAV